MYRNERDYKATLEQVKSFPIVEYASMIGYTPVKKGSYWSLKEHDSVMIDPRKNTYRRYSQSMKSGSIIDFSMEFEDKDMKTAFRDLKLLACGSDYTPVKRSRTEDKKLTARPQLSLPERDTHMRNAYAYLVNTRCIDKSIVDMFIKNKNLYQDTHKNCVFVGYDQEGKANFANKRGTNTFQRFVGDCLGCDYTHCFLTGNRMADTMVVTESVIDSMSVMTVMKQCGRDLNNYAFLALSGTPKFEAVSNQAAELPNIKSIVLAVDNDPSGFECIENIKDDMTQKGLDCRIIEFLPKEKDWNAHLQEQSTVRQLAHEQAQSHSFELETERGL